MIFGEGVRLRAVEREDLPRYVEWFNDPQVTRGLTRAYPMSLAEEIAWFEDQLGREPSERSMAIDVRQGDRWIHIGGCGLQDVDWRARHAALGITIGDRTYWGKGLGSEVVRLLLRHGFETMNLNRIHLRVYEFNQRAIEVYRRAGFKEEGRLRMDMYREGRHWDAVIMGILRHEWDQLEEGRA